MSHPLEAEDYTCDKFVVWYDTMTQVKELRKVTDKYFQCIDRGNNFLEFVPHGYSKATGIKYLVEHFGLDFDDAYAFGDSSNDLPMLRYVKNVFVSRFFFGIFFLNFFALTTSCRFARAYRSRTNLITKHSSLDLFYQ